MHPHTRTRSTVTALALVLVWATLWLLIRGYHGLTGDAQIYAFQALARLRPQLANDLYMQNTSQDQFTLFSPFYAVCIDLIGLENAARLLTVLVTVWLLGAMWSVARAVSGREGAWLAVAFLLIVAGEYGGSGVFRISEQFLTARLPAEAMIVTALACHIHGRKGLGLLLAAAALPVHPLIALPGVLLLMCMSLRPRAIVVAAVAGLIATIAATAIAISLPGSIPGLSVMDAAWAGIVRERSQFLFLPLWSVRDWEVNARPFIYLGFTAIAVPDRRVRKLCTAAALVGAAGLTVAWIGSEMGPVAILVQGQAWRWVWISVLVSVLLLPGSALEVWRDDMCGPLCAVLLVSGWTLPIEAGLACASIALVVWVVRSQFKGHAIYLHCTAAALGVAILAWVSMKSWTILSSAGFAADHAPGVAQVREIFGLPIPAILFGTGAWWCIRNARNDWVPMVLSVLLAALSISLWPAAFKQSHFYASAGDDGEFSDWIGAIPPTSTVLVTPPQDVGGFVWFTLERPNYLAMDQSAGVVFSRATALEVERRSTVLLLLMDPDWKILTRLRTAAGGRKLPPATRALTAGNLRQVCGDPKLGFVLAPEDVGIRRIHRDQAGSWKGWNLYDCKQLRSAPPAT